MKIPATIRNQDGIALLLVLLIAMAVGAMAITAVLVSGNSRLITQYEERQDELESVADAGLEQARSAINGDISLYPESGFRTLEDQVAISGLRGIRRSTYVGPTGVATGQFGVFGSIVSVAEAPGGVRVIRRGEIFQESFAKFAYFTDVEPSNIAFGSGDQIQGPVHSNDTVKVYASGATFRGPVTTAQVVSGAQYASFMQGYEDSVPRIEMPRTAELDKLRGFAQTGGAAFTAPAGGNPGEARIRIEFVWVDVDGDGLPGEDEGFFRVYTSNQADWLMAIEPGLGWTASDNCGPFNGTAVTTTPARLALPAAAERDTLRKASTRCFPGGAPELAPGGVFRAADARGQWMARPFALTGSPPASLTGRADAAFLFPLGRRFNPDFKGVIHVTGRVAISGTLRGRITLAATDDVFVIDDLRYATDPGAGTCADILGLFGGSDIFVADNGVNTPQQIDPGSGAAWYTFDDSSAEFVHAVVLALNTFAAQDFSGGPTTGQSCEGTARGRGCLYLTGGIIQRTRGGVGTTGGHGYLKRYSYDQCAYRQPPPYYPTTGRFGKARYFEVDPNGFTPASFYDRWTAG